MGRVCNLGASLGGAGRGGSAGLVIGASCASGDPGARVVKAERVVGTSGELKRLGKLVVVEKPPTRGCWRKEGMGRGNLRGLVPAKVGWRGLVEGKRKCPLCDPSCLSGYS